MNANVALIMTIVETLKWASEKLKNELKDASDSSMLEAQILLSAVLNVSKTWLFTHFDQEIKEANLEQFRQMIKRRLDHEPVAYIIGEKEFYKRKFLVNQHTLIPRPATETLVETAIKLAARKAQQTLFADIGTGSGAIAITLAAETGLPVIASDISPDVLTAARKNAENHRVTELVDFRQGDLLEPLEKIFAAIKKAGSNPTYDQLIICANLPYLTTKQWSNTEPEVKIYEPKLALEAGEDGLDLYWRLIREIKKRRELFPQQLILLLEIDPDQTEKVFQIIKHDLPLAEISVFKDLSGLERVVVVFGF